MLSSLYIENIAVIEKCQIDFSRGFTVLTGETGAGKSIVIDAINAVLGQRIARDMIRTGAASAYVSAVFNDISPQACQVMEQLGYQLEEDGTLLLQRVDNPLIQSLCENRVTQSRIAQRHQQLVFFAVDHLLGGKRKIDEIFSNCTRKRAAQGSEHFFGFFGGQFQKRLVKLRDDFTLVIDITSANMGDVVFFGLKAAANFRNFFFVHAKPPETYGALFYI